MADERLPTQADLSAHAAERLAGDYPVEWVRVSLTAAVAGHEGCGQFCLNPLHPGPCKGWKKGLTNIHAPHLTGHVKPSPVKAVKKAVAKPKAAKPKGTFADSALTGKTGEAALASVPLRLVEHKKDVLGDVKSKPGPGMTPDEAKSLSAYRKAGFVPINKSLRKSSGTPSATAAKHVAAIDAVMARSPLASDISVHRGVGYGPGAFGDAWGSPMTGRVFTDHGYASVTADVKIAGEFAHRPGVDPTYGAEVRVHVPKGTPAVGLSDGTYESELLLARGLTFKILSDTGPGPQRKIEMVVMKP